jgi:hypothetical protein
MLIAARSSQDLACCWRAGKLEYVDLRELQDTTPAKNLGRNSNRALAPRKALNVKFEQLAELRNGILHSRALSEVVRKEGEAAILWFRQVLTKMIRSNVDHEGGDYFIKVGWH